MRSLRSLISKAEPGRSRGATLIELVVTMAMLGLLTTLLFAAFELGTRVFRDTTVRQSSENQLRAIKLLLERDIHHANIWLCNSIERPVGSDRRDALCMPTLDDWEDVTNYDVGNTERPIWNRYVVWYATTDTPTGTLFRQVIEPPAVAGGFTTPYAVLGGNLNNEPSLNSDVLFTRFMSEDVINFQTRTSFQDGTLTATLRLQAKGGGRPGTLVKTEENLQVDFTFRPKNSWPRI